MRSAGAHALWREEKSSVPHVYLEFYRDMPESLRAENINEVRTMLIFDWTYDAVGHYESTDLLKQKKENIFQGGCRIRLVDRETKTVLHSYHMLGPDTRRNSAALKTPPRTTASSHPKPRYLNMRKR